MFITGMPNPLHLRQLANVIYQTLMDGTVVAEVHLDRSITGAYSSGFLPLRERNDANLTLMLHRKGGKRGKMGKEVDIMEIS